MQSLPVQLLVCVAQALFTGPVPLHVCSWTTQHLPDCRGELVQGKHCYRGVLCVSAFPFLSLSIVNVRWMGTRKNEREWTAQNIKVKHKSQESLQ